MILLILQPEKFGIKGFAIAFVVTFIQFFLKIHLLSRRFLVV